MFTKYGGTICSIGVTASGKSYGGEASVGSASVGGVQRTEKWAAKLIFYKKKNLRSTIFQNAKLNKRNFNNCDFFNVQNSS